MQWYIGKNKNLLILHVGEIHSSTEDGLHPVSISRTIFVCKYSQEARAFLQIRTAWNSLAFWNSYQERLPDEMDPDAEAILWIFGTSEVCQL